MSRYCSVDLEDGFFKPSEGTVRVGLFQSFPEQLASFIHKLLPSVFLSYTLYARYSKLTNCPSLFIILLYRWDQVICTVRVHRTGLRLLRKPLIEWSIV